MEDTSQEDTSKTEITQPIRRLQFGDREFILVGTAHVSQSSIDSVRKIISEEKCDCVCIELDEARYGAMTNEQGWQEVDIVKILKEGKGFLLLANLVLSSFQKKIGNDVGIKPGDEMKAAIESAKEINAKIELVDRPIHTTLKRAWGKTSLVGKSKILASMLEGSFSNEKLTAEQIESLKKNNEMDTMMQELADYMPQIKETLIDERDRYLGTKIYGATGKKIVAVLGAGHLNGTEATIKALDSGELNTDLKDIEEIPPKSAASKALGFLFPALIVALVVGGFFMGKSEASIKNLITWLVWNGGLAAIGTLIAGGHPLTILCAFVCAPVATLNPFIGIGLFTGIFQAWLRKPQVKDMMSLSDDITSLKGWYKNKIAHVLLIFFCSSFGGVIGNIVAFPALIMNMVGN